VTITNYRVAIIEILIFTGLFYVILRFLRETRGSGVIRGLSVVVALGFVLSLVLIQWLDLTRLRLVYDNLVSIALIGVIVVFQPEIRRAITHIGDQRFFEVMMRRVAKRKDSRVLDCILRALQNMSMRRTGALIAIEQVASLNRVIGKGQKLDSGITIEMLEAIFYPGSPMHDGGVIVRDDRLVGAGCVFPVFRGEDLQERIVTRRRSSPKRLGTRHRAALGLSIETDALVLIVSEETGAISVAHKGRLHMNLDESDLRSFLKLPQPKRKSGDKERGDRERGDRDRSERTERDKESAHHG
jgi:diadenylate cyclase